MLEKIWDKIQALIGCFGLGMVVAFVLAVLGFDANAGAIGTAVWVVASILVLME